jgi:hypothetical protein
MDLDPLPFSMPSMTGCSADITIVSICLHAPVHTVESAPAFEVSPI